MANQDYINVVKATLTGWRQHWKSLFLAIWQLKPVVQQLAKSGALNGLLTADAPQYMEGNADLGYADYMAATWLANKVGDLLDQPMTTVLADAPQALQDAFQTSNYKNATALDFMAFIAKANTVQQ